MIYQIYFAEIFKIWQFQIQSFHFSKGLQLLAMRNENQFSKNFFEKNGEIDRMVSCDATQLAHCNTN